ncbi:MAG: type II toxin-antitoxin system RelE/ParE family toxin [Trueperaceae bacterium]
MIRTIRHKGLKRLYERNDASKVQANHAARLQRILFTLDHATEPRDMNLPGFRLHPLKGDRRREWAVDVSGNWRVTFTFNEGGAYDVDYEDYH